MDPDWSGSRLPSLDIVLLCLDGTVLKLVSTAVRYLDQLRWSAVKLCGLECSGVKRIEVECREVQCTDILNVHSLAASGLQVKKNCAGISGQNAIITLKSG